MISIYFLAGVKHKLSFYMLFCPLFSFLWTCICPYSIFVLHFTLSNLLIVFSSSRMILFVCWENQRAHSKNNISYLQMQLIVVEVIIFSLTQFIKFWWWVFNFSFVCILGFNLCALFYWVILKFMRQHLICRHAKSIKFLMYYCKIYCPVELTWKIGNLFLQSIVCS